PSKASSAAPPTSGSGSTGGGRSRPLHNGKAPSSDNDPLEVSMSSILQANRGTPLTGLNGPQNPAGTALGGNQARPASSAFEQVAIRGAPGPSKEEQARSKAQQEALEKQ